MEELTLQEIKRIEFDLLKMFDSFCKENDIKYFLSNGTLLGAVKYKGFIPWDDDIDIFVPREDYNRLIALFKDDENYCLFAFEKNSKFLYPFAKLCNMKTRKEEKNTKSGVVLGIDIDIFPLDAWKSDLSEAKRELKWIRKKIGYLMLSKKYKPDSKTAIGNFVKGFKMIFCKLYGSEYFIKKIIKHSKDLQQKDSAYLGCKAWCIYGEREIIPTDIFSDTVYVDFEGKKFPAPIGYDKYLRSLYGDYEQDPPIEKRKTHHGFVAYKV